MWKRTWRLPVFLFSLSVAVSSVAADQWQGKRAAVVFTYDDTLNVHLDKVAPALDAHNFKGTFYLAVGYPNFQARLDDWRALANNGHELGNHTMFHPCEGGMPGREWVSKERDLSTWSVTRMVDEITMTNTMLQVLDGKTKRTFAYTCGDTKAGGESFVAPIKQLFVGARGVKAEFQSPQQVDLFDIRSVVVAGQSAQQLTAMVDEAIAAGGLLVFLFHGVGGEHPIDVALESHNALLDYVRAKQQQLWVAPMVDVAEYIQAAQAQNK